MIKRFIEIFIIATIFSLGGCSLIQPKLTYNDGVLDGIRTSIALVKNDSNIQVDYLSKKELVDRFKANEDLILLYSTAKDKTSSKELKQTYQDKINQLKIKQTDILTEIFKRKKE